MNPSKIIATAILSAIGMGLIPFTVGLFSDVNTLKANYDNVGVRLQRIEHKQDRILEIIIKRDE